MDTIEQQLTKLVGIKKDTKTALTSLGLSTTDDFTTYPTMIANLPKPVIYDDLAYFYANGARMSSTPINTLITSSATSMQNMFYKYSPQAILDLSTFNTSNVTNMVSMFDMCGMTSVNLSSFNTSKVLDMTRMFGNCSSLVSVDISTFDTSKVTSFMESFFNCATLTSFNLPDIDTSSALTLANMFAYCFNLESIDFSNVDLTNVTSIAGIIQSCYNITSVSLLNKITPNLTNWSYAFNNCVSLKTVDLSGIQTEKITESNGCFYGCAELETIVGLSVDYTGNSNRQSYNVFDYCTSLTSVLFKSGGTMGGKSGFKGELYLDLSPCTAFTEAGVIAMINSCTANTSGKPRVFYVSTTLYSTLLQSTKDLFTAKNYQIRGK